MDRKEYDEYMCDKYPVIFKNRGLTIYQSCMAWGFDIGEGWQELLDKLCEKIQLIMDTTGIEVHAAQVKEKYGGLRFYVDIAYGKEDSTSIQSNTTIDFLGTGTSLRIPNTTIDDATASLWCSIVLDLIDEAESRSLNTCEKCGKYGKPRKGGWINTLCDDCADGREGFDD